MSNHGTSSLNPCYYNNPLGAAWASARGLNDITACCSSASSASAFGSAPLVNWDSFPCTTCIPNALAGCYDNWGDCQQTSPNEPDYIGNYEAENLFNGNWGGCLPLVRAFDSSASKWVYGNSSETPFWYYNHRPQGGYGSEEEWASDSGEYLQTYDYDCVCWNGMLYTMDSYVSDGWTETSNFGFVSSFFDNMVPYEGCEGCCACAGWSRMDYPNYPYKPWAAHTCCTGSVRPLQSSSSSSPSYKHAPPKPSWTFPRPWPLPPIQPTSSDYCVTGPCPQDRSCSSVKCCGQYDDCHPVPTTHIAPIHQMYYNFGVRIEPGYDYRGDPINPSLTSITTTPWYIVSNMVAAVLDAESGMYNPILPPPIIVYSSRSVASGEIPWYAVCVSNCGFYNLQKSSSSLGIPELLVGKQPYCTRPWWTHTDIRTLYPYGGTTVWNWKSNTYKQAQGLRSLSPYSPEGIKFRQNRRLGRWGLALIGQLNWFHQLWTRPYLWSNLWSWCYGNTHKHSLLINSCMKWWLDPDVPNFMINPGPGNQRMTVHDIHFHADDGWKGWVTIADYCKNDTPYNYDQQGLWHKRHVTEDDLWIQGDVPPERFSSGLIKIPRVQAVHVGMERGTYSSSATIWNPFFQKRPPYRVVEVAEETNTYHFWIEILPGAPPDCMFKQIYAASTHPDCTAPDGTKCATLGRTMFRFFPDALYATSLIPNSSSSSMDSWRCWRAKQDHVSVHQTTHPGVGSNWQDYWLQVPCCLSSN